MPYPNEHANRVKDPGDFQKDSFRRKVISPGVSIVVGKPTGSDKMVVQSYRFDREKFTAEEAKKWLADHNVKGGSFEAATGKAKEASLMQQYQVISQAIMEKYWPHDQMGMQTAVEPKDQVYIADIFPDYAIIGKGDKKFKIEYTIKDGEVVLSDPIEVEGIWKPVKKEKLTKDGMPASCYLVVEDPQKVTTWHLPVKTSDGKPDHNLMGAAWAALTDPNGHRGQRYQGPGKQEAISKLRKMYEAEGRTPPGEKSFKVFKQANGEYRWVAFSSSAFRDLDGELITAKALEDDCDRCDKSGDYGPLRWWHVGAAEAPNGPEDWATWKAGKGIDIGTCDFNMVQGRMLIESGTFKDAATGEAFATPEVQANLQLSIAFAHPADEPNEKAVFDNIHRFERSLLPYGTASNLLTRFAVTGEKSMKIEDKLNALIAILKGKPEVAKQILEDAASVQKAAEDAGLEYKEVTAMLEEQPAAEQVPTEPAQEQPAEEAIPDTVGNMTLPELQATIMDVFRAQAEPTQKEAATQAAAKEAEAKQIQAETIAAIKSISDRLAQMETSLKETQQSLHELTDARPVGIKQLQTRRPTEQESNVTTTPIVGPHIDVGFLDFFKRR